MSIRLQSGASQVLRSIVMGAYILLLLMLMLVFARKSEAKVVNYASGVEQVRIKHGGPTIFRFQVAVQTITGANRLKIEPANKADPNYMTLAVTPRFTNGANQVNFLLSDGSVVKTNILVNPNDPAADGIYDFMPSDRADEKRDESAAQISAVELLKAMIRDAEVNGYSMSRVSEPVYSKVSNLNIELVRIYKGTPFNGYVFRLTNTGYRKAIEVDVRKISVGDPNLAILSQSDEEKLLPKSKGKNQTFVRIVAKNTASSRDVVMPLEAQDLPAEKNGH